MKYILTTTLFLFFAVGVALAQPGNPGSPVPIGGLEYLIAAGAALGIKKLIDAKKKGKS